MGKNGQNISRRELQKILLESKKRIDYHMGEFDRHSREFDRKVSKILAAL